MTIHKILLVDDDPDLRRIGILSLRNIGKWQVKVAASGMDAIAALQTEIPDLILLDVMMPDWDGRQTLLHIRELPTAKSVPVIFLTAKEKPEELRELMELGAKGVIVKPFPVMTLPQLIRQILEKPDA